MTDLVERLREIGAHYSACDRQQTIYEAADALEAANERNRKLHRRAQEAEALRMSIAGHLSEWEEYFARTRRPGRWVLRHIGRTIRNRDEFKKALADFEAHRSADALEAAQAQAPEVRRETVEECAKIADDHAVAWGHAMSTPAIAIASAIRALTDAAKGDRT